MYRPWIYTLVLLSLTICCLQRGLLAQQDRGAAQAEEVVSSVSGADEGYVVPVPVLSPSMDMQEMPWQPDLVPPWRDEVLLDGGDRRLATQVDADWEVHGLDTEDTVAHFDTLSGQRLVTPSNRVGIYSPRFRAVRKVTNMVDAQRSLRMAKLEDRLPVIRSQASEFSTTTLQNIQPQRNRFALTPAGFRDRTRGVNVDNTTQLAEFDNGFKLYEDFTTLRYGGFEGSEKARLAIALQKANVWSSDLEVLSNVSGLRLVEAKSVTLIEETVKVRNQVAQPALRLVKVGSRMEAQVGDEIEFTLRFDNIGNQAIGNVTILDNLTGRLEYVPDSGQCSLPADLVTELNEAGSLRLRWEIINPLEVGEGGIIRFKCIVR